MDLCQDFTGIPFVVEHSEVIYANNTKNMGNKCTKRIGSSVVMHHIARNIKMMKFIPAWKNVRIFIVD